MSVAFAIAAILMVLALLINLAATLVGSRYFKRKRCTMNRHHYRKRFDVCGTAATQALTNICMEIPEKSITALIGPSGCGKSTFLKTLNRMNDLVPGVQHRRGPSRCDGRGYLRPATWT